MTVQKRCQQAGHSRRAVQRGRRSFVVVCDARAASELSPIAVISASRPCLSTVDLSPGSKFGAVWLRHQNTRTARQNVMRSGTRSQCKSRRSGEMRSNLRLLCTNQSCSRIEHYFRVCRTFAYFINHSQHYHPSVVSAMTTGSGHGTAKRRIPPDNNWPSGLPGFLA